MSVRQMTGIVNNKNLLWKNIREREYRVQTGQRWQTSTGVVTKLSIFSCVAVLQEHIFPESSASMTRN